MPASPDVLNYFIGKGTIVWTPTAGSPTTLGNAPEFELTPEIETLEHFSSQTGVRSKDREIILEKTLSLRIVLDEITPENLAMALLGTVSTNSDGDKEFSIYTESDLDGAIVLTGTNDIGNKFTVNLPSVSFIPSGTLGFISDEFGQIELTGDVLSVGGSFGTVTETAVAA